MTNLCDDFEFYIIKLSHICSLQTFRKKYGQYREVLTYPNTLTQFMGTRFF